MPKDSDNVLEMNGTVVAAKGNSMFEVKLDEQDSPLICTIGGKIRKNNIKIMEGSYVKVELSVYDLTKGRIVYRIR